MNVAGTGGTPLLPLCLAQCAKLIIIGSGCERTAVGAGSPVVGPLPLVGTGGMDERLPDFGLERRVGDCGDRGFDSRKDVRGENDL